MSMDIGLNKECPWGGDTFHNDILSFWIYMPPYMNKDYPNLFMPV